MMPHSGEESIQPESRDGTMDVSVKLPSSVAGLEASDYQIIEYLLHHDPVSLDFGGRVEAAFRRHHDAAALEEFKASLGYLVILYTCMAVGAIVLGNWASLGSWPVTYSIFGVILVSGFVFSHSSLLSDFYQRTVTAHATLVMALAVFSPTLIEDDAFRMLVHVGTVYAVMVIYLGLSLRLPYATLAVLGGGIPVAFTLYVTDANVDWDMLLATFVGASALCTALSYRDEKQRRRMFLQSCLLEMDRARVSELAEELEQMSLVDSLTGLANRRQFDRVYSQEWARCQREAKPLALIFLDVDHFKDYNDYFGHQRGDDCLRKLSQVFADAARRPTDLAARYGGEEFVILLPETAAVAARQIAEALSRRVQALGIPHPASQCAGEVTVSAGVAVMQPAPEHDAMELVRMADKALYEAKQSGRNRVIMAV